ncbi:hypothetical protein RT21_18090 [Pseudomonas sp. 10B238]|jgi:uncharacterized membrane protein|uniref:DUF2254 domain-containing protein n=1 Tax=Pseudomonadaceae TaxID=135621 RepID=UPI00061830DA|nr:MULTISPECIES: DUF2254 domain-containing protein [Pseudomonadaceae]MAL35432.1 DUF2254 domain-containing protein [Pseudomonas sp.]KJJ61937.1 hypothetical protein RT21_18090 [Pseudomonas sp. 10B238]MBK3796955.1 DUF2254 domain-containing protein [Stutzerimonas stutzeri]MBK3877458.1 DUF2254 domain-containing protein [Stutzerimonas stutzeri]HBM09163.1 DUF2254 domain-containing protein [Pseudomonas sp.]|tara:strand:- start:360 stop:1703 length:1344 start_codon:yes stop_codon:yes gene_type:complete
MSAPANKFFRSVKRVTESIAFYPVLIPAVYAVLAVLVLAFESTSLAPALRDRLPPGLVDADNSREVLSTLITGIISLTVFSFSMVMVVLNGAAARLSPRVLPGLVSDLRNQVILGIYLGSIVYCLMMIGTLNGKAPASVPALGLLLALVFGMFCMALFVVFIRSVSQSIQVEWILSQLYNDASANLKKRKNRIAGVADIPDATDWWCLPAARPGYLREVNECRLGKVLRKHNLTAMIQVEPGFFLIEGHPLIKLSTRLSDTEANEVLDCFDFHDNEFAGANVSYGMRQISEIAVKAISPAINDPGTAIRAINLLGVLLKRLGGVPPFDVGCCDGGRPRLFYPQLEMPRMLQTIIAPIRIYGGHDPQVLVTLLQCLRNALHGNPSDAQREALHDEIRALRDDADAKVGNPLDRQAVNEVIERVVELQIRQPAVALLPIDRERQTRPTD